MKRTLAIGALLWILAGATAAGATTAGAMAAGATTRHPCHRFIVGRANSTAYPHFRLPAHGGASGASCATLRRIARRLNDGSYPIPMGAGARAPAYGRPFPVGDRGRRWSCRLQEIGSSGPTYAVRCRSRMARLAWHVG